MSVPESLINSLYRASNISRADIQSIITSFQSQPKQVDEDIDIELNIYDTETRDRIVTGLVNPGGNNPSNQPKLRADGLTYIREIPSQVNVYPLQHTKNGTGNIITTGRQFEGGWQTTGSYYQSIANATRLNPTTNIGIVGWLRIPSGATSGKIVFKDTQYNLEISAANTLSFNVNSKTPVTATFTDDTWFHFAATYASTASGQKIYINGVLMASNPVDSNYIGTSSGTRIGNEVCCSNSGFPGLIDEVRVFSKIPHDSFILNNYKYSEINKNLPDMYYKFDNYKFLPHVTFFILREICKPSIANDKLAYLLH